MKKEECWPDQAVNYQVNVRALTFREPRNVFEALNEQPLDESSWSYLTRHLEQLKPLGITVLHIMPPFEMGQANKKGIGSPYAIRDYSSIDPEYGTLDEFKELLRRAHELGFKVIIGMVPNHTSRDNVWIYSNPEYYAQNEHGDIMFDLDWSDTAKLDYTKAGLRKAMLEIYDLWLGILGDDEQGRPDGVDGFRVDMAHFINDRTFWDEILPVLKEKYAHKQLLFLAECYGIDDSMDMFRRGFNACYDDAYYKLLEHYYGTDYEGNSHLFSPALHPGRTQHSPHYQTFQRAGYAAVVREVLERYEGLLAELPEPVWLARYTDNHDEGRGVYRFGQAATRVMMELAFMSNHAIPFLLCGQEFGAVNRPSIHHRFGCCDKGREVISGGHIFYQDGIEWEGNTFLRTPEARDEMYQFYQRLARLRAECPALRTGSIRWVDVDEGTVPETNTLLAFVREKDGEELRVLVNLGHEPRRVPDPAWLSGPVLYGCRHQAGEIDAFTAILVRAE